MSQEPVEKIIFYSGTSSLRFSAYFAVISNFAFTSLFSWRYALCRFWSCKNRACFIFLHGVVKVVTNHDFPR